MTPNRFLEMHVNDLLGMQIDYAFLRNSRGYPEMLTGDIDLLVEQPNLNKVYRYYKALNRQDIRVVQIIERRRDLYVMLFFPQGGNRKYLVLEYFTGIVFRGTVIVSGERLLADCDVDGVWRRLSDQVSISYTFFHYVIYKGHLPTKYQSEFDDKGLDRTILDNVLSFLGNGITPDEAAHLLENPAMLRDRIRQRISRVKTIGQYVKQLFRLRPENFGCSLRVNPADADAVIKFADKYHLCRPTHRYILWGNPVSSTLKACVVVAMGGLAVLPRADIARPESVDEYFDRKFGKIH